MVALLQLPGYESKSALLNLAPLNDALDFSAQQAAGRFKAGLEERRLGMDETRFQNEQDDRQALKIARGAMVVDQIGERDPRRLDTWRRLVSSDPRIPEQLQKFGVDPSDHIQGPRFILSEAGKYDPLAEKLKLAQIRHIGTQDAVSNAQLQQMKAQTPEARARFAETTLGLRRGSPEWQGFVANGALQAPNEIMQMVTEAMRGQGQPAPAQSVAPPATLQPQSMPGTTGEPEARLIPTQAVAPQAQPQAAPAKAEPTVQTPLGPMSESKARLLGFGIAMSGKNEAGKMFVDAANTGNLGKEGQNEIDKKLITAADNLANLTLIQARFKPEYQQVQSRLGYAWSALQDKLNLGQLPPADRAALEEFSAYRADAIDAFNTYIKSITGAAMTESEAKRIQEAFPKAGQGIFDGNSPTEFKAKLDGALMKTKLAIARYNYAKAERKDWQYIGLSQMPKIVQEKTDLLHRQMLQQNMPADQIPGAVQRALKQEFGI